MTIMLPFGIIICFKAALGFALEGSPFWDYPGLELWKFINLAVFLGAMFYILKRPLTDGFRSRKESIRRELLEARQQLDHALTRLNEIESRLANVDAEVANIQQHAAHEAEAERKRIGQQSESEIASLRERAQRDIENAAKVAAQDLRLFVARESVRLAEATLRSEISNEDDRKLVQASLVQFGGRHN